VLVAGAILSPGRRTVAAALRVTGQDQKPTFTNYHRVLNRNRWRSRSLARSLLRLLISTFVPSGPVVIGLDDTLERRWGVKIKARGILSRSGALLTRPLRPSQWAALALCHAPKRANTRSCGGHWLRCL
jgi:DDE superfamily endonuclease